MNIRKIKNYFSVNIYIMLGLVLLIISCEDVVPIEIPQSTPQLVVDAWINDKLEDQTIRLTMSSGYFDSSEPEKVRGASVVVTGDNGDVLNFIEASTGVYVWTPTDQIKIEEIGVTYTLAIIVGEDIWTSQSTLNRVPPIDSLSQEFREDEIFGPDGIYANFFARDPVGTGDTYWIKTFKNEEYLNEPLELNIAYDAGFDPGAEVDGLIFISPIRELINRFADDSGPEDVSDVPPWVPGDSIYVELLSLNEDAWFFLDIARDQITNGENGIFTLPIANAPGNVANEVSGDKALGIFCVSAVSSLGGRIE